MSNTGNGSPRVIEEELEKKEVNRHATVLVLKDAHGLLRLVFRVPDVFHLMTGGDMGRGLRSQLRKRGSSALSRLLRGRRKRTRPRGRAEQQPKQWRRLTLRKG